MVPTTPWGIEENLPPVKGQSIPRGVDKSTLSSSHSFLCFQSVLFRQSSLLPDLVCRAYT